MTDTAVWLTDPEREIISWKVDVTRNRGYQIRSRAREKTDRSATVVESIRSARGLDSPGC